MSLTQIRSLRRGSAESRVLSMGQVQSRERERAVMRPVPGRAKRYPSRLTTPRIELLNQILAQDPANKLARYGLAMEYVNTGDLAGAIREFEAVLAADPAYTAAYFHGGQTLEKLGRLDEARDYYRRGIAATSDPHARGELEAALAILGE
jgi:tetratricopeptide (TPR) repeat protein